MIGYLAETTTCVVAKPLVFIKLIVYKPENSTYLAILGGHTVPY